MTGWDYTHSAWMGDILQSFFTAVFVVLLIGFILVSFRCFIARNYFQPPEETPLDILKKRYARGEISTEEYDHMKHFLES